MCQFGQRVYVASFFAKSSYSSKKILVCVNCVFYFIGRKNFIFGVPIAKRACCNNLFCQLDFFFDLLHLLVEVSGAELILVGQLEQERQYFSCELLEYFFWSEIIFAIIFSLSEFVFSVKCFCMFFGKRFVFVGSVFGSLADFFYFVRLGNFEHTFRSCVVGDLQKK